MLTDDNARADHYTSTDPGVIAYHYWLAEGLWTCSSQIGIDMMGIRAELDAWTDEHMLTDVHVRAIEDKAAGIHEATVAQMEIAFASCVKWSGNGGLCTGFRSTWFKRRFGLLNSGQGLLDEPTPVSPWLSGLLSTLLQWPGVEFRANDAAAAGAARTAGELLALVEGRKCITRSKQTRKSYQLPFCTSVHLKRRHFMAQSISAPRLRPV